MSRYIIESTVQVKENANQMHAYETLYLSTYNKMQNKLTESKVYKYRKCCFNKLKQLTDLKLLDSFGNTIKYNVVSFN